MEDLLQPDEVGMSKYHHLLEDLFNTSKEIAEEIAVLMGGTGTKRKVSTINLHTFLLAPIRLSPSFVDSLLSNSISMLSFALRILLCSVSYRYLLGW